VCVYERASVCMDEDKRRGEGEGEGEGGKEGGRESVYVYVCTCALDCADFFA
jgi:hypothetical protein